MSYRAINSASGKIEKLLIAYDGEPEGKAFIKDIFQVIPKEIELLVYVSRHNYKDYNYIAQLAHKFPGRNIIIFPHQESSMLKATSVSPWIRDQYVISQNASGWGMIPTQGKEVAEHLMRRDILKIEHDTPPDFFPLAGNILIEEEYMLIDKAEFDELNKHSPNAVNAIMKTLFPNKDERPRLIPIGKDNRPVRLPSPKPGCANGYIDLPAKFKHIDLCVTPTGILDHNRPVVFVGQIDSPHEDCTTLRMELEVTAHLLSQIADQLEKEDFIVLRNPIPLLKDEENRYWIGFTNNCLVEKTEVSRKVWLPDFSDHPHQSKFLTEVKKKMKTHWVALDFEVHFISGGMSTYSAEQDGSLHCLTLEFRN